MSASACQGANPAPDAQTSTVATSTTAPEAELGTSPPPTPSTTTSTTLPPESDPPSSPTAPVVEGAVVRLGDWNLRIVRDFEDPAVELHVATEGEYAVTADDVVVAPTIQATYLGDHFGRVYTDLSFHVLDATGTVYQNSLRSFERSCQPDIADAGDDHILQLLRSGTVEHVDCWSTPVEHADDLVLVAEDVATGRRAYLSMSTATTPVEGSTRDGVEPSVIEVDAVVGEQFTYLDWTATVTAFDPAARPDEDWLTHRSDHVVSFWVDLRYSGEDAGFVRGLGWGVLGPSRILHTFGCGGPDTDLMDVNLMFPGSAESRDRCVLVTHDDPADLTIVVWDDEATAPFFVALAEPETRRVGGPPPLPADPSRSSDDPTAPGRRFTNPVALGTPVTIGEWEYNVTSFTADATAQVRAVHPDAAADPGNQYIAFDLTATHVGTSVPDVDPWTEPLITVIGDVNRTSYDGHRAFGSCSIAGATDWDPSVGMTLETSLCWQVDRTEAEHLTLLIGSDDPRHYISLTSTGD